MVKGRTASAAQQPRERNEGKEGLGGDRRRILLISITIMTLISLTVGAMVIYQLYRTAVAQQRGRLVEIAQSRARLLEAVARFDARHADEDYPGGPWAATLSQLRDAHARFSGFGETGEFTLARRVGDQIVFLLSHRHGLESPQPVPFQSALAEPMRRALLGESGTVVGLDYRGASVLAAYEPLAGVGFGIVAKIDLAEIRAPFIKTGLTSAAITFAIIALGVILLLLRLNPLILKAQEQTTALLDSHDRLTREVGERQRAEEQLRELAATLEQQVSQRTEELEESRNAALNMMQDAVDARRDAETELTERKRAEENLTSERNRAQQYLDVAGTAFVALDREGRVTLINAKGCEILEYEQAELLGQDWFEKFLPPATVQEVRAVFKEVMSGTGEQVEYYENPVRTRSGEERVIAWHNTLLRDPSGNPRGTLSSGEDITERKRAEAEIRLLHLSLERRVTERTAELEATNKDLEAFAYSVSHDLRGPLRAIDGFCRILLAEHTDQLDAEGQRLLTVVRDNSGLMGQLIEGILEFSRVGRRQLQQSSVDMNAAVASVLHTLEPQYPDRQLGTVVQDLPPVDGDGSLIGQVWANLISNAVKFTANSDSPSIEVRGSVENGENVYAVSDNGAGFDMRHVRKLFGLFQSLHSRDEFAGTGVGLAIVKRVVERHGGRVWAEGEVDRGATFYFALPNGRGE